MPRQRMEAVIETPCHSIWRRSRHNTRMYGLHCIGPEGIVASALGGQDLARAVTVLSETELVVLILPLSPASTFSVLFPAARRSSSAWEKNRSVCRSCLSNKRTEQTEAKTEAGGTTQTLTNSVEQRSVLRGCLTTKAVCSRCSVHGYRNPKITLK